MHFYTNRSHPAAHLHRAAAGAGGKTLALSAQMENTGRLLACDVEASQLRRAATRYAKAGVGNVEQHLTTSHGRDSWLKRRKRSFDRVLADVPCSGIGLWRRNPSARWSPSRPLGELLQIQAELLERAARLVRPSGTLVYVTRSLLPEENEQQLAQFLVSRECDIEPPVLASCEPDSYLGAPLRRHQKLGQNSSSAHRASSTCLWMVNTCDSQQISTNVMVFLVL